MLKWELKIAKVWASEDYECGGYIPHPPEFSPKDTSGYYKIPAFKNGDGWQELPELTLDNIYEYAIPKLQDKGYSITLVAYERNEFGCGIFDEIHDVSITEIDRADSPTEALYNAILKVIDNKVKPWTNPLQNT